MASSFLIINRAITKFHPFSYFYQSNFCRLYSKYISLHKKNDIGVIKIGDASSKVNKISEDILLEFENAFTNIEKDDSVRAAVLISTKPDCFIAGADIKMIRSCTSELEAETLSKSGQDAMMRIETCKKPIVAAIMGSCLGGGLELALACHYRIAVDSPKTLLGLPEVKLGLIPGAGGTQRMLSSCAGVDQSLQMLLTGSSVPASKAKKIGLVHQVVKPLGPGLLPSDTNTLQYLENIAVESASQLANGTLKPAKARPNLLQRLIWKAMGWDYTRKMFFDQARRKVMKMTHGLYPAPLQIIDLFNTSVSKGSRVGYEMEAKRFAELSQTPESNALIGLFFGHTECKKQRLPDPKQPIKRLGVLGAGLMGAGIAQVSIQRGIPTVMKDVASGGLARGEEQIQSNLNKLVKRKRMTSVQADRIFSTLESSLDLDSLRNVDMVIEAVFEDLGLKHRIVQEVETVLPPHAIFASNTSAIPITKIAQVSKRPDKFIGMHYFSPVDRMELLEIIVTEKTSQDTLSSAINVGLRQGKVNIVVKDGPGFYTTRLLGPTLAEATALLSEGVSFTDLNKAATSFGWPVGIVSLIDEVGVDVALHVYNGLRNALGVRMQGGNADLLQDMVKAGFLGRKSGKGFFVYTNKKSGQRIENQDAVILVEKHRVAARMENSVQNMQQRLLMKFVNESVLCLQEGVLMNGPVEGDIGAVFGLGFPPYLGGPFRYLDKHNASKVVDQMKKFRDIYGEQFSPCPLLLEHANDTGKRFHKS